MGTNIQSLIKKKLYEKNIATSLFEIIEAKLNISREIICYCKRSITQYNLSFNSLYYSCRCIDTHIFSIWKVQLFFKRFNIIYLSCSRDVSLVSFK